MKKFLAFAVATFSLVTTAQASLLGRNVNGAAVAGGDPSAVFLYDTDLNVTWLANANLAASNDFGVRFIDPTGYTDADSALKWIGAMNTAHYRGFSDWRLPTTLQPDSSCGTQDGLGSRGLGCKGSEMGHLFYEELGGMPNQEIATTHNANYGSFQNLQSHGFDYWSGTKAGSQGTGSTWEFDFGRGSQFSGRNLNGAFMLAVRPGDVVASVPEPHALLLMLAGLSAIAVVVRRRLE